MKPLPLTKSQVSVFNAGNFPMSVHNCGMCMIYQGHIYQYLFAGWSRQSRAQEKDYLHIPELTDDIGEASTILIF